VATNLNYQILLKWTSSDLVVVNTKRLNFFDTKCMLTHSGLLRGAVYHFSHCSTELTRRTKGIGAISSKKVIFALVEIVSTLVFVNVQLFAIVMKGRGDEDERGFNHAVRE